MSSFVILGGGKSQLPFVEAAKELSLHTIVLDTDPNCPASRTADEFITCSIRNPSCVKSAVLTLSQKAPLSGLMTYSANPITLMVVAELCEQLNFPSFSSETLALILDKGKLKGQLQDKGVRVPQGIATADVDEAKTFQAHTAQSLVIKPALGTQGSQGVNFVMSKGELDGALSEARATSENGFAVVEEYIAGLEYSVDGVVIDGVAHTLSLTRKHNLGANFNFVMSKFETCTDDPRVKVVERLAHQAVKACGLDQSFFSVDVLDTGKEAYAIECGVMLDCKIDRLLFHSGFDVYRMFVQMASGNASLDMPALNLKIMDMHFLFANHEGVIKWRNKTVESPVTIECEKKDGAHVTQPSSISDVVGWVIGTPKDIDEFETSKRAVFEVT